MKEQLQVLLGQALDLLAEEVKKRTAVKPDVSADELAAKLTDTLAHADWLKELVKDIVVQHTDLSQDTVLERAKEAVESRVPDEVQHWMEHNFDLSNYENEVERMAENAIDNYDFSDTIREGIDDYDFDSVVEGKVEEKIDEKIDELKSKLRDAVS